MGPSPPPSPYKKFLKTFGQTFQLLTDPRTNHVLPYAPMKIAKKYLDLLQKRKLTKRALALHLNVSESYLCRITDALPPGKVRAERNARSALAAARRQHRIKLAKRVQAGTLRLETAAAKANCSERTMYRYLCRLEG